MIELINQRLKAARETRGLTQAALSEQLGFKDRQTLAAIEAGQRKLAADELLRAMQVLELDLDYFTDPYRLVGEGQFSWRTAKEAGAKLLDDFEARAGCWVALYRSLEELKAAEANPLQQRLTALTDRSDFMDAQVAAESLVRRWDLGEIPALGLEAKVRDALDALVLYVDAPKGISGAACHLPELNAILINRNEPEGRRHYDLAHETFHLLTWEQMPPDRQEGEIPRGGKGKKIEQLADNFASALLMPERSLKPRWDARKGQGMHAWLNATATEFLVTAVALKWRLVQLGWLGKDELAAIKDNKLTSNGQPPGERPKPRLFSAEFAERLRLAVDSGNLSVRKAASLLDTTIEDLAELFRSYELPVPFDL